MLLERHEQRANLRQNLPSTSLTGSYAADILNNTFDILFRSIVVRRHTDPVKWRRMLSIDRFTDDGMECRKSTKFHFSFTPWSSVTDQSLSTIPIITGSLPKVNRVFIATKHLSCRKLWPFLNLCTLFKVVDDSYASTCRCWWFQDLSRRSLKRCRICRVYKPLFSKTKTDCTPWVSSYSSRTISLKGKLKIECRP